MSGCHGQLHIAFGGLEKTCIFSYKPKNWAPRISSFTTLEFFLDHSLEEGFKKNIHVGIDPHNYLSVIDMVVNL